MTVSQLHTTLKRFLDVDRRISITRLTAAMQEVNMDYTTAQVRREVDTLIETQALPIMEYNSNITYDHTSAFNLANLDQALLEPCAMAPYQYFVDGWYEVWYYAFHINTFPTYTQEIPDLLLRFDNMNDGRYIYPDPIGEKEIYWIDDTMVEPIHKHLQYLENDWKRKRPLSTNSNPPNRYWMITDCGDVLSTNNGEYIDRDTDTFIHEVEETYAVLIDLEDYKGTKHDFNTVSAILEMKSEDSSGAAYKSAANRFDLLLTDEIATARILISNLIYDGDVYTLKQLKRHLDRYHSEAQANQE